MKTQRIPAILLSFFVAFAAMAQDDLPPPPPPDMPGMPDAPDMPAMADPGEPPAPVMQSAPSTTTQPAVVVKVPELPQPQPQASASPSASAPAAKNEIRLNFQGASLTDVLNYLSEAAGFVIVQEAQVSGTVNVVSKQPLSADEAVDLLNAVLLEKGFIAIRNGRILKIVSRSNAQTRDLPVITGSNPETIPRKDDIVTQILPVRYVEAAKLIENLRPLLSPTATINANENSNAILMTDTQTNIRRIAEIIRALDTSISSISTMHVFALRYADAKDLATTLTQLFATDASSSSRQNNQGGPPGFFGGFGRGGGGGNNNAQPASEARKAAARVVAVADSQSNSVVVSAPDEYMPTITEIVSRLDTNITEVTETRIYRLQHADATELSNILTSLYPDTSSSSQSGNRGGQGGGGFGGFGGFGGGRQTQTQNQQSDRSVLQARVITVPDPRTNSVIVTASHETMEQVALTIGRLDASDSKKQHVYVHVLEHADPDNVATVLRGMFGDTTSNSTSSQPASNALNQRTTTGASADVTGTLNTSGSGSSGRSGSTGR
jgi:type II secretory pathway component GspD/PulD (secretin)